MNAMVATGAPPSIAHGVWQLARFDLRRFRLLALLVGVLEISRAAFVEWSLRLAPIDIVSYLGGPVGGATVDLFDVLQWLVTAVTTAVVVQADLPRDDRAFWRTRPIAPLTLALGKLTTFALLFVGVPSAINAARLLGASAPLAALAAGTVQIACQAAAIIVPAWGLSLATRTLPRFIGVAIGSIVGGIFLWTAGLYWASVWLGHRVGGVGAVVFAVFGDWQRVETLGWGAALVISAAAVAIVAAYYRHGRPARSLATAALLFVGSVMLPEPMQAPQSPDLAAAAGRLSLFVIRPPAAPQTAPETPVPAREQLPLHGLFTLPPLPSDVSAAVVVRRLGVHVGGLDLKAYAEQCCFGSGPMAVVAAAFGPPRSPDGFHAAPATGSLLAVLDPERLRDTSIAVDGDASISFQHHRLTSVHALREGITIRLEDGAIDIVRIDRRWSLLLVRYRQFPRLSDGDAGAVSLFIGDVARTRVSATTLGWGATPGPGATLVLPARQFRGRQWAGRFLVFVADATVIAPGAQLYVVQSRDAGTARTRLSIADVKTWSPVAEGAR